MTRDAEIERLQHVADTAKLRIDRMEQIREGMLSRPVRDERRRRRFVRRLDDKINTARRERLDAYAAINRIREGTKCG